MECVPAATVLLGLLWNNGHERSPPEDMPLRSPSLKMRFDVRWGADSNLIPKYPGWAQADLGGGRTTQDAEISTRRTLAVNAVTSSLVTKARRPDRRPHAARKRV